MGNQASVAGGTRATSVYPPHVPSHTPSGKRERRHSDQDSRARNLLTAHGVPISGVRKWSGGAGTPVTYETPPCINVKVCMVTNICLKTCHDSPGSHQQKILWSIEDRMSACQILNSIQPLLTFPFHHQLRRNSLQICQMQTFQTPHQ